MTPTMAAATAARALPIPARMDVPPMAAMPRVMPAPSAPTTRLITLSLTFAKMSLLILPVDISMPGSFTPPKLTSCPTSLPRALAAAAADLVSSSFWSWTCPFAFAALSAAFDRSSMTRASSPMLLPARRKSPASRPTISPTGFRMGAIMDRLPMTPAIAPPATSNPPVPATVTARTFCSGPGRSPIAETKSAASRMVFPRVSLNGLALLMRVVSSDPLKYSTAPANPFMRALARSEAAPVLVTAVYIRS